MLLSDQLCCLREQCNKSRISVCISAAGLSRHTVPAELQLPRSTSPAPSLTLKSASSCFWTHTALSSCWQCPQSPHCHYLQAELLPCLKPDQGSTKQIKSSQAQIWHLRFFIDLDNISGNYTSSFSHSDNFMTDISLPQVSALIFPAPLPPYSSQGPSIH